MADPDAATTAEIDDNIGALAAETVHHWKYGDDGELPTAADVDIAYVVLEATYARIQTKAREAERQRIREGSILHIDMGVRGGRQYRIPADLLDGDGDG